MILDCFVHRLASYRIAQTTGYWLHSIMDTCARVHAQMEWKYFLFFFVVFASSDRMISGQGQPLWHTSEWVSVWSTINNTPASLMNQAQASAKVYPRRRASDHRNGVIFVRINEGWINKHSNMITVFCVLCPFVETNSCQIPHLMQNKRIYDQQ